jgi:formate dehydrogenase (NADP+) alpha subunit
MMIDEITLAIDGSKIKANRGDTVLKAALDNGIYIPHLCYHPELKSLGACRLCMVEIKGRGLTISCKVPVEDGMVVTTESPEIDKVRRIAAELLIADHDVRCLECARNTDCKLQEIAAYIGIDEGRLERLKRTTRNLPVDDSNPFFSRDLNKCILCGICIQTCDEIQGVNAIDFAFRGHDTKVSAMKDKPIIESACVSCGECVVRCPVGALIPKTTQRPAREVRSICCYCGCGCGIKLGVRGNTIVGVQGDVDSLASKGRLCVKGRFGIADFIHHSERLTAPLIRRNGRLEEASWDEALELVASRLKGYKPDEVAVIASAKCTNEENYVMQKFARAVLGTNNVDHCARLCHAPTVAGLAQSFGSGAMTNSISEIADAACIFAIGTNTTEAHPIIGLEVKRAVKNGAKLIVANPREIDLCRFASLWLRHKPGTDVALLMGMMRVIVEEKLFDSAFIKERCEEFDAFRESLKDFDLDFVEQVTSVPKDKIVEAARMFASNRPATILYSMGITQHSHGTDNVLATANLAMLTGNIGKPSTGVNPLRGQNNVQGACDMGALPNVYPAYQAVSDPAIRKKFEAAWGGSLSPSPGLTLVEIIEAAYRKDVKSLYLVGENPALSDPDVQHVREALARLEFLVVQDMFLSETAEFAHVVLPAASFVEKDGTFTNTERRVQRVRKAIEPIGDSRPDWWIICQVAQRLGAKGFDYSHPFDIMEEIRILAPSYGGISYRRLEKGGLQWPCPVDDHPGTPILHTSVFVRGKGRFMPLKYMPPGETPDKDYPLILTTGRSLYHFHTGTMTRKVAGLNIIEPEGVVQISPQDASQLGIGQGDRVKVSSRRGEVMAKAEVTRALPSGVVFMTFHFAESAANILTNPKLDPVAKIPEFKVAAVKVEKL